jgi:hypothetical protein
MGFSRAIVNLLNQNRQTTPSTLRRLPGKETSKSRLQAQSRRNLLFGGAFLRNLLTIQEVLYHLVQHFLPNPPAVALGTPKEAIHKRTKTDNDVADEEMLRSAALNGKYGLVRDLIRQGINVNAPAPDGSWTALAYAAAKGYLPVVRLLLVAGAEVNPVAGRAPIGEAAYWGQTKVVELLISAGADINQPDTEGWTPLMKTIAWNSAEAAKLLLKAGADTTLCNYEGKTALAIAQADGKQAIVKLLCQTREKSH